MKNGGVITRAGSFIRAANRLFLVLFLFSICAQSQTPLSTNAVLPRRFISVHGRRAVIMGYSERGLEIWAYPLQILSNYRVGFKPVGSATEPDGRLLLRRVIYRPDSVTRVYIGPDYIVRENLFIPLDQPGAILSYRVESPRQVDIDVHFTPVLNLMWPAALGGQSVEWSPNVPGYVLAEHAHGLSATISSHEIVAHDDTVNSTVSTEEGLSFSIRPSAQNGGPAIATVYVALETGKTTDPSARTHELSTHQAELEAQAKAHYAQLEGQSLRIRTADEKVNQALAWAEAALDQAWVCNPHLGCGIVAGYGPSRNQRRPQYAWYFAGDGLVATRALVAAGEYSRAREELEFIAKYQDMKTGMIWHELSQSAGYLDWSKYPYMFAHVDITFDYLSAVARYTSISGDLSFSKEHWPSLVAAYGYCRSLIHASDHLPHIPAGKMGIDEQDRPSDDLDLSSSWVAASAGFAELAALTGHSGEAGDAMTANRLARQAIAARYWDAKDRFWIGAHTASGKPIIGRRSRPSAAIRQNVFSQEQNEEILDQLASSNFQSDWGERGVAANSAIFDPKSYSKGSVSALGTAEVAKTFWLEHRPYTAFQMWSSIIPWNTLDSLGHIHEVLAGDFYHPQVESVPEQTWSSAGLLEAAVRGLLGLDIHAAENSLDFTPHLPPEWHQVSVANIRLPHSTLAITLGQSIDDIDLEIRNEGIPAKILFQPEIPLGARIVGAECDGHHAITGAINLGDDRHAKLEVEAPPGRSHCRIQFTGGVSLIPVENAPGLGDPSTGMKVTHISFQGDVLSIDADVNPAGNAGFRMRTPWKITGLKGASLKPLPDELYEVTMREAPGGSPTYTHVHAEITFADR